MWVLFRGHWCLVSLLEETKIIINKSSKLEKNQKFALVQLYTLLFIGYLLAGVTFVVVVCGNSNEKDKQAKQKQRGISIYSGPICSNVG